MHSRYTKNCAFCWILGTRSQRGKQSQHRRSCAHRLKWDSEMEEDCSRNRAQAAVVSHQREAECAFSAISLENGDCIVRSQCSHMSLLGCKAWGRGKLRWTERQTLRMQWLYTKVERYWEQEFWGKRDFIDTGQGWRSQGWRQVREWDKKGFFSELLEKPVGSQSWEIRSNSAWGRGLD